MGILLYLGYEYARSIKHFNMALSLDPTNYLLLNKVGATMANLGRAD